MSKTNGIEEELDKAWEIMWLSKEEVGILKKLILTRRSLVNELLNLTPTIRSQLLTSIWLNGDIIRSFNECLSQTFIKKSEIFFAIKNFFEKHFPMFDFKIYKYEFNEDRNCERLKEIWSWRENIDLNLHSEKYFLEILTLESGAFEVNHDEPENNSFASCKIGFNSFDWKKDTYLLSFKKNDFFYSNLVKNTQFTTRLEILFKKSLIAERISAELSNLQIFIDWLTWLYNKTFIKLLKHWEYIILVIDVNDFKKYNDTLGHHQWDIALKEFSKILQNVVRRDSWDLVARSWWDEFLVFVEVDNSTNNKTTAETIKARIEHELNTLNNKKVSEQNNRILNWETEVKDLTLQVTIWYSLFDPEKTFEDRFKEADLEMYKLKDEEGRMHRIVSQFREFLNNCKNIKTIIKLFSMLSETYNEWYKSLDTDKK